MAEIPKFQVRVTISCDDPQEATEKESQLVKAIASAFLRMGVTSVTAIADNEHVNYVDNEVHNVTTGDLFRTDPLAPLDVYLVGQGPASIN
jgi:hypothetical protein